MDSSLLLPREKYAAIERRHGRGPITFEIKSNKQVLFYFGANHSRNPTDPQYPVLIKYWERFIEATKNIPRIVLHEGRARELIADENQAIANGSEGSLMTLLAHKSNIPVGRPDLSNDELNARLPDLNMDEVLLYNFLTWLNNFKKNADPKLNFEKSAQAWCDNQKSREIWSDTNISLTRMKVLYKKILFKNFNENESPSDIVNPNKIETPMNRVARAQSDLRDLNIASAIERHWNEGKSIFAVFGRGHLIIQEPALKSALLKL